MRKQTHYCLISTNDCIFCLSFLIVASHVLSSFSLARMCEILTSAFVERWSALYWSVGRKGFVCGTTIYFGRHLAGVGGRDVEAKQWYCMKETN